jgi:predicted nucleotidyltransferase component of viral defense system
MITEAEIRRLAARWRTDPMIINLDYTLSWFLAALAKMLEAKSALRFKGGTCLRKCYFPGYRFSEDLDFTATRLLTAEDLNQWVLQSVTEIAPMLPGKFQIREVDLSALNASILEKRRHEYEQDWKRRLNYLIPDSDAVTFEEAWQTTIQVIR